MVNIDEIIKIAKLHPLRVHNIYIFGSRVYGTHHENSDWDILIVGNNSVPTIEIKNEVYNIHIYTPDEFIKELNWGRIKMIECLQCPSEFKLQEKRSYEYILNIPKLRHASSHLSSNSWVKCKKKLELGEYEIGIKSLFHSFRMIDFSCQIMEHGKIVDFTSSNHIMDKLRSKTWSWDEIMEHFKPMKNELDSKFRKLTYKE